MFFNQRLKKNNMNNCIIFKLTNPPSALSYDGGQGVSIQVALPLRLKHILFFGHLIPFLHSFTSKNTNYVVT